MHFFIISPISFRAENNLDQGGRVDEQVGILGEDKDSRLCCSLRFCTHCNQTFILMKKISFLAYGSMYLVCFMNVIYVL
jgi:hypothetical protein